MLWCVIMLASSLESNAPKACFDDRETCRAYVAAMHSNPLRPAQCERRTNHRKPTE